MTLRKTAAAAVTTCAVALLLVSCSADPNADAPATSSASVPSSAPTTLVGDSTDAANSGDTAAQEFSDAFRVKSDEFYAAAGDRAVVLDLSTQPKDGSAPTVYTQTRNPDGTSFAEGEMTGPDGARMTAQQACTVEACFERLGDDPWAYVGPADLAVRQSPSIALGGVASLKASDSAVRLQYFKDGDSYRVTFASETVGDGEFRGSFGPDSMLVVQQTGTQMLTARWTYGEPVAIPTDLPPAPVDDGLPTSDPTIEVVPAE